MELIGNYQQLLTSNSKRDIVTYIFLCLLAFISLIKISIGYYDHTVILTSLKIL